MRATSAGSVVHAVSLLLLLTAGVKAHAGEAVVKNDHFNGSGQVSNAVLFAEYDGAGALFEPDPAAYPLTIKAVDVLLVPIGSGSGGDYGAYLLDVWDEAGSVAPPTTNTGNRYSSGVQLISSKTQFNRFTFPSPVVVASGRVFVGVRQQFWSNFDGTTVAMDEGPRVPGANWYFRAGGWTEIDGTGSGATTQNRNWIIRLVLEVPDVPDAGMGDAGMGDAGMGDAGTGEDAGPGGDAGVTPDSGMGADAGGGEPDAGEGVDAGTQEPAAFRIDTVSPEEVWSEDETPLVIVGAGFADDVQLFLGGKLLGSVTRRSGSVAEATVPSGFAPGVYDVAAVNGDGERATLKDAVTVHEGSYAPVAGCGCGAAGAQAAGWMALLLGLGLAAAGRRRRSHS